MTGDALAGREGPRLFLADGPDGPLPDPDQLAELAGLSDPEVLLGWVVRTPPWLESTELRLATLMMGTGIRSAVDSGRMRFIATRLSGVPNLLGGRLRPEVAVIGAHEAGSGAPSPGWQFHGSPGVAAAAARYAGGVIIERWPGPAPRDAPLVEAARVIAVIDRVDPPDPPPANRPTAAHHRIGELVAGLIPEGATIQWGPGGIGAAVVSSLTRRVRVRSGLVTEELADLAERGLLAEPAEAAYVWGGRRLHDMVDAGLLRLRGVEYTHDLTLISSTEAFVAINTALQVGLDGAVNVESVGGRLVAGPGGHPDFAAGASRSRRGLSVVALAATSGAASTIVARPDVVSTARSDVDVVVTEHGIADLRHRSDAERAPALIAIAAPEHRHELADALDGRRRPSRPGR